MYNIYRKGDEEYVYLYFENSIGNRRLISQSDNKSELIQKMMDMCQKNNFKVFYMRILQISEDIEQYDVGSWSEFFYISKNPMEERDE